MSALEGNDSQEQTPSLTPAPMLSSPIPVPAAAESWKRAWVEQLHFMVWPAKVKQPQFLISHKSALRCAA